MASRLVLSLIFCFLVTHSWALSALKGSPCYTACDGSNPTTATDIVCTDNDLSNTPRGQTLDQCLNCLSNSSYAEGYQTDAFTFLYYIALIQQTCLAEPSQIPLSYCSRLCDQVDNAISSPLNGSFFQSPYDYCTNNNNDYTINGPSCVACLQSQAGSVIVGNFVEVGVIACMTQPAVWNGTQIAFSGGLFDTTTLSPEQVGTNTPITMSATVSSPTNTASGAHTSNTSHTSTSTTSATATSTHTSTAAQTSPGLSRSAAAGIGFVVGLIGIAGVVAFAIFARKRRQKTVKHFKRRRIPAPLRSLRSLRSARPNSPEMTQPLTPVKAWITGMSPRSSQYYYAANPKAASDLSALPQRDWR